MTQELAQLWFEKEEWGFNSIVPRSVMRLYYRALLVCANGDGILTEEERDWIVGRAAANGLPGETVGELQVYWADDDLRQMLTSDLPEGVTDISSLHRCLIRDAIRACSSDGEYHEEEQAAVHKMAEILEVPDDVVKRLEETVAEITKLRQEEIALMFPDGKPF